MICGLALMGGQDHRALAVEWLAVSAVAAVVYVYGHVQAIRRGASSLGLQSRRLFVGTTLQVFQIAALLLSGYVIGLYHAAISMTLLLAFMVSGAWLLIMGASQDRPA